MKTVGLLLFSLQVSICELVGQVNLVPNPSFELFDTCPTTVAQIRYAMPWFQPNDPGNYGSTDYFNQCNSSFVSVPSNLNGFQYARTGVAYAFIGVYISVFNPDVGREYLEVRLSDTLLQGRRYCGAAYVALSNDALAGTSNLQLYFSSDSLLYSSSSYAYIPASFQISYIGQPIIDTLNWTPLYGFFTAMGTEKFVTIGNFSSGSQTQLTCLGSPCGAANYYIDDVSVVLLPDLDAGSNDTICLSDSTTIIGTISETWPGMSFEWLPHTGLSNPFSLSTTASPNTTTTYTLTVSCATCDVPCLSDIPDSVTISVVPQLTVGADDTLCLGDSILISGSISQAWPGIQYEWLPHTGLSDPFSLSTFASPAIATTYTLAATCPSCGFSTCATLRDSIHLAVKMDCDPVFNEMIVPTLVGSNQRWEIMFLQPNTRIKIYDERGRIIFETENYQNNWTPEISGAMYFFEITRADGSKSNGKMVVK